MKMEIFKNFTVESAHFLPNAPEGHKCRRLHGHSFKIEIHVTGEVSPDLGWVIDFGDISKASHLSIQSWITACLTRSRG